MSIDTDTSLGLNFNNTYANLPDTFYAHTEPESVAQPQLIKINHELAAQLGFNPKTYSEEYLAEVFSGNKLLEGSSPIAQAYAGHQFGGLSPQLGDGRACLLGEVITPQGHALDMQLKGSGRTAFSRRGDGKATLSSVLREYLISEAMVGLDIPTTRSLAVVASGETVQRESAVPGGVLTRIASSHIRVGTFQYFAVRGDLDSIKILSDYTIEKHYPELKNTHAPYLGLLSAVMDRQIHLVTQWMRVGFIHGVMNTDNIAISGETIDFGPCAFLDTYDPNTKFSSIDSGGRYAFSNQGPIALWNLARFAETLISLVADDEDKAIALLSEVLETYADKFSKTYTNVMGEKFGLINTQSDTADIVNEFLETLHTEQLDYTLAFRSLNHIVESKFTRDALKPQCKDVQRYESWKTRWTQALESSTSGIETSFQTMQKANPVYIPRNWYVEEALKTAAIENNFEIFNELLSVLKAPYTKNTHLDKYATTPFPSTAAYQTFCGT